ncbi:MAG: hypothetical protein QM796_12220 [Chthoniobacteraceae bacterium]
MKPIDYFFVISWNIVAVVGFLGLVLTIKASDKLKMNRTHALVASSLLFVAGIANFLNEVITIAHRH